MRNRGIVRACEYRHRDIADSPIAKDGRQAVAVLSVSCRRVIRLTIVVEEEVNLTVPGKLLQIRRFGVRPIIRIGIVSFPRAGGRYQHQNNPGQRKNREPQIHPSHSLNIPPIAALSSTIRYLHCKASQWLVYYQDLIFPSGDINAWYKIRQESNESRTPDKQYIAISERSDAFNS